MTDVDLRAHIDKKFSEFVEKQERRDVEDRHERRERDDKIYGKVDALVEHDHQQDMKIAENKAFIERVDTKVDDDIGDMVATKEHWRRKFQFRWRTVVQVLGWVFGSGGAVTGIVLLVRAIKGG